MNNRVYIVKCDSYEKAPEQLEKLLAMMGGMKLFAQKGEHITLKANLLAAAAPGKAVSTHPAVVAAVGSMAKREGAVPLIADSPGSGYRYTEATLRRLYVSCQMDKAAELAGIALNWDTGYETTAFPDGRVMKRIEVIRPVIEADGVFNLCKMKTHLFMHMTGAVKNHFGIIPGLSKVGYHAKLQDKGRFADMLLDLALFTASRLSIMDAVLAMEGQGPGASGTPRQVGLLLASENPVALDVVAAEIMGLPREQNPVIMAAERRSLSPCRIEEVEVVGEPLSDIRIPDYVLPETVDGLGLSNNNNPVMGKLFRSVLTQYPAVIMEKCAGCGVCRDACPQKAIVLAGSGEKKARIDKKHCIRCYCCHELCPHRAVVLRKNPIAKLLRL